MTITPDLLREAIRAAAEEPGSNELMIYFDDDPYGDALHIKLDGTISLEPIAAYLNRHGGTA